MNQLRITRSLFEHIRKDLARPHKVAVERVGFMYARTVSTARGSLLLAFDYLPVKDEDYLPDPYVGAKFGSAAIRSAMQRALTLKAACLHVHMHPALYPASFSSTDIDSNRKLTPSFMALVPKEPHGAVVWAGATFCGTLWQSGIDVTTAIDRMVVVGYPLTFMRNPNDPE